MENINNKSFRKAKQRVEDIKEFYKHLIIYILVNLFLTFIWNFSFKIFSEFVISNQFTDDGFTHVPIWFIWGVFLAADAIKTFVFKGEYGRNWEEKKVKEFMNQ